MEPALRGALEKAIEAFTAPTIDLLVNNIVSAFPSKNLEDLVFGVIVGYLWGTWRTYTVTFDLGKEIKPEDSKEFWEMMEKRTLEIKGKIKLALNK